MANKDMLKKIAARAAEDQAFAVELDRDPVGVIEKQGVKLTEKEKADILAAKAQAKASGARKAAADASACYIIVV